jgi:hypothetical protein
LGENCTEELSSRRDKIMPILTNLMATENKCGQFNSTWCFLKITGCETPDFA